MDVGDAVQRRGIFLLFLDDTVPVGVNVDVCLSPCEFDDPVGGQVQPLVGVGVLAKVALGVQQVGVDLARPGRGNVACPAGWKEERLVCGPFAGSRQCCDGHCRAGGDFGRVAQEDVGDGLFQPSPRLGGEMIVGQAVAVGVELFLHVGQIVAVHVPEFSMPCRVQEKVARAVGYGNGVEIRVLRSLHSVLGPQVRGLAKICQIDQIGASTWVQGILCFRPFYRGQIFESSGNALVT
ncbi:hypothetical protein DSECCO2_298770 [anaerobic digester metagenome]